MRNLRIIQNVFLGVVLVPMCLSTNLSAIQETYGNEVESKKQVIVCVPGVLELERHAGQEFTKYAKEMIGFEPKTSVYNEPEGADVVVSIGSSAVINSLVNSGLVKVPENLGREGFIIKSVETNGKKYLVLYGGGPAGTLYAVYHYLETICKVGFFWDGERIPKFEQIPLEGIDIIERPRFADRQYFMSYEYTTYWWDWQRWQKELDWAAKHRFNIIWPNLGDIVVRKKVWKRFGIDVADSSLSAPPFTTWATKHKLDMRPPYPTNFQQSMSELGKKIASYARSLGIRVVGCPGYTGQVPNEFYEVYRDKARFIKVPWVGIDYEGIFIHPSDPLYVDVWKAYIEEYTKSFGTDHIWSAQCFGEMRPGETVAQQKEFKIANAKSTLKAVTSADPQGKLVMESWAFVDKELWPKEDVKAWLDIFPSDLMQVWELWPDMRYPSEKQPLPMYKELDYYFGKPWLLGFLHSFAGNTSLHGDLVQTINYVQQITKDPKAVRCSGIRVAPEVLGHNYIFYDLISRLGWNPEAVDIESFLKDYAQRRYGRDSATTMVKCLKELIASVYGSNDGSPPPLYHYRLSNIYLSPDFRIEGPLSLADRNRFLPHLQKALEIALQEANSLSDDILYQHDIVDIARQYLGDLFNLHMLSLYDAFKAQDTKAFEVEAGILEDILNSQEMLLSSSDYFCLQPLIAKAMALPNAPDDYDQRIRDILTIWAGHIIDYAHRDYYETIRFYYHPRVSTFISHLHKQMAAGSIEIKDEELTPLYQQIEQAWVKKPLKIARTEKSENTPLEAVRKVLEKHRLGRMELKKIDGAR